MTVYLDCNATTPVEPEVREIVLHYMEHEYGNAGSRTHEFGQRASDAVKLARKQVASVVKAESDEVIFTSGATESLNLAILGLRDYCERVGKKHIVSTTIEHKAVLEPLEHLKRLGFEVTLIQPQPTGAVAASDVADAVRNDTALVAVMQVNNETGTVQPIGEICDALSDHQAFFLVDAAQGFGKEVEQLCSKRIDLISISGHKLYAPMGVGALVMRKRKYKRVPLTPLMFGGGQERGLRPGTLPVPLIAGMGLAAEIAVRDHDRRRNHNKKIRAEFFMAFESIPFVAVGAPELCVPHVINFRIPGVNSEALMLSLRDIAAVSNGSACTSHNYTPSHVVSAIAGSAELAEEAVRFSWSHLGEKPDWGEISAKIQKVVPVSACGCSTELSGVAQ